MPKWPAIPNYSNSKVFKLLNVRIWKWLTSSNEFSISNSQLLHCAHCSLAQWVSKVSIFFQFIIKSFQYFINIQLYQSHYIWLKLIQQISTRNQWTSFYKTSCKKHFKFVPNLSKKYEKKWATHALLQHTLLSHSLPNTLLLSYFWNEEIPSQYMTDKELPPENMTCQTAHFQNAPWEPYITCYTYQYYNHVHQHK